MSEEEENNDCKIVLIGESGVGKTSIITRLTKDEFSENQETTMGASYTTKVIKLKKYNGREIKVNIWDTAGQEAYRSLTKIFYKEASIAILVYDITKKDSFIEMKDYWYQQLLEYGEPNVSKFYIIILFFIFTQYSELPVIRLICLITRK